jgi:hypothetical protein
MWQRLLLAEVDVTDAFNGCEHAFGIIALDDAFRKVGWVAEQVKEINYAHSTANLAGGNSLLYQDRRRLTRVAPRQLTATSNHIDSLSL